MKVITRQKQTIIHDYEDKEKAEIWLSQWVAAWEKQGWVCTEWKRLSHIQISAKIESELEVGEN